MAVLAAAVLTAPSLLAAASPAQAQPQGQAQAQTPWAKRVTGYLPARDGLLLKYSALLPKKQGRFPVIVNYSGYDAGSIGGSAYRQGNTTMDPKLDAKLLKAGYAVVGVNMAATGCSQGRGKGFDLFAPRWGTDGYDAVEWIARQGWSNGAVGMANWSFAGLSQVFTATERPPHLKAIAPGMVVTDPWRDNGAPGGVVEDAFPASWWVFILSRWTAAAKSAADERDAPCLGNLAANVFNGHAQKKNPAAFSDARTRPEGAFGAERNLSLRAHKINVPVLSMVAWQDEATGPRGGYYQDRLDPAKTFLVGTNGPHDTYTSTRWQAHLLRFFDRYIKGISNGFDKQPRVQLWMESTGGKGTGDERLRGLRPRQVITRPRLPLPVRPLRLALRAGGRLSSTGPAPGEPAGSTYHYPAPGPDSNKWDSSRPAKGTVAFTTAPLTQTATFAGSGSLDLWVSSTAPDADIQATVTEVRPDGQEVYVQRGWLRLSERATDPARSTPLRPHQRLTTSAIAPIKGTQPVLGRLEVQQFAHTFRRGSAIRVWLEAPSTTGSWGFDSPKAPSTLKVFHDKAHRSQLVLGLLHKGGVTIGYPACNTLLSQPCRPNPLAVPSGRAAG